MKINRVTIPIIREFHRKVYCPTYIYCLHNSPIKSFFYYHYYMLWFNIYSFHYIWCRQRHPGGYRPLGTPMPTIMTFSPVIIPSNNIYIIGQRCCKIQSVISNGCQIKARIFFRQPLTARYPIRMCRIIYCDDLAACCSEISTAIPYDNCVFSDFINISMYKTSIAYFHLITSIRFTW